MALLIEFLIRIQVLLIVMHKSKYHNADHNLEINEALILLIIILSCVCRKAMYTVHIGEGKLKWDLLSFVDFLNLKCTFTDRCNCRA